MQLVLFFSRNTSLRAWDEVGMFDREVAIYRRLQERGVQVSFITYGDSSDLDYGDRIPGIRIICNRWGLSYHRYVRFLTWIYPFLWRGVVVFKSNQVKGAEVALEAARRFGKPFVARCGYPYADIMAREHGSDSPNTQRALSLERQVLRGADQVVVTTPAMRQGIIRQHNILPDRVSVIPNYVETDRFFPDSNSSRIRNRICFVGRLHAHKNLLALLEAVRGLDVELLIIGDDVMREELQRKAETERLPVRFLGSIPNHRLPSILNTASLFVLPSLFEGHPKVLLEAMACGLPVVGTDAPGIRELIIHGESGWLCGTSSAELRKGIKRMMKDTGLQSRLARNARKFVVEQFSLDRVIEMELTMLKDVARHINPRSFVSASG